MSHWQAVGKIHDQHARLSFPEVTIYFELMPANQHHEPISGFLEALRFQGPPFGNVHQELDFSSWQKLNI